MGSTNDKESCNKFHKRDAVSYQLNDDDEIRTGFIISTGNIVKIKESLTNIIHFAPINKVWHLRFQFRLRY